MFHFRASNYPEAIFEWLFVACGTTGDLGTGRQERNVGRSPVSGSGISKHSDYSA